MGCSQSSEQEASQRALPRVLPEPVESAGQKANAPGPELDFELWQPLENGIFIATTDDGRPIQAQVLVGLGTEGRVKIGSKQLSLSRARQELLAIRKHLTREVGLTHFAMVMDIKDDADRQQSRTGLELWQELGELAYEVDSHLTPCGIGNFRQ